MGGAAGCTTRLLYHRPREVISVPSSGYAPALLTPGSGYALAHPRAVREVEAAWRFVRSGALVLGTIEHAELQHVHGLMSRCGDRPMDFADGTLVYLAKREFLSVILTVDHADFATYRLEGKRQFRVLPANHP